MDTAGSEVQIGRILHADDLRAYMVSLILEQSRKEGRVLGIYEFGVRLGMTGQEFSRLIAEDPEKRRMPSDRQLEALGLRTVFEIVGPPQISKDAKAPAKKAAKKGAAKKKS